MKKKIIIISVIVIVIAVFVVVNLTSKEEGIEVQTEKVFIYNITQTVTGNGKIYPETEIKISPRVAGKIISMTVKEGDSVKIGRVLVELEQEQYKANFDKAKSSLLETKDEK